MNEMQRVGSRKISDRAERVGRVPSKELSEAGEALRQQGKPLLSLAGAPYWLPPEHVFEAAAAALREPAAAPSNGFPELRAAVADRLKEDDGISVDPESEVLITAGAMHGLWIICTALLNPGDEVVMYAPAFVFSGPIELAGGVPIYAATRQEDNWRWNAGALEGVITPKTKMVIINSPTNPTGYVAERADLEAVAELARRHDLLVLSDECYDTMIYDGHRHVRFASLPAVRERAITVCSMTKSYAMPSWRVGYVVAPPALTPHLRRVLEWNLLTCNHVAQRAAQAALEGAQDWVRQTAVRFQRSRDLMIDGLADARGISLAVPGGAPFLFLNVEDLNMTGEEVARELMHHYGVPAEGGTPYGSRSHVRLMLGAPDEVVQEAASRIREAAGRLAGR